MSEVFSPKWGPYIDPLNNCRSPWPFSLSNPNVSNHFQPLSFWTLFLFFLFTRFYDNFFFRIKKDKLFHIFAIFILLIYTTTFRTHLHIQWNIFLFFFWKNEPWIRMRNGKFQINFSTHLPTFRHEIFAFLHGFEVYVNFSHIFNTKCSVFTAWFHKVCR